MASKAKYLYSPLEDDHIRLLMIEAGPEKSIVRCRIEHFKFGWLFDRVGHYHALSYEWGNSSTESIILNGHRVAIRRNLWNALWHLRLTGFTVPSLDGTHKFTKLNTRWIWIDALCIDQENTHERNHQVRFMGKIYTEAIGVFAWLGCRKNVWFGSTVYVAIQELAVLARADPKAVDFFLDVFGRSKFHELVYQPYWRRMWIVQEITLARDITILFDDVSAEWKGLERLRKARKMRSAILDASQAFRLDRHRKAKHQNTLEDLIETSRNFECNDPRDKIYALLALAVDCQDKQIEIDYSKSLFDVYWDTIQFYSASHSKNNAGGSLIRFSSMLQGSFDRPPELAEGAKAYDLDSLHHIKTVLLEEHGFQVGVISKLGSPVSINSLQDSRRKVPPHLYWRKTQISRTLREMTQAIPVDSEVSFAIQAKQKQTNITLNRPRLATSSASNSASSCDSRDKGRHDSCLPFFMANGVVGYAPANCQIGDIICQFPDSDISLVLRRQTDKLDILGRCCITSHVLHPAAGATGDSSRGETSQVKPRIEPSRRWRPEQRLDLYLDIVTLYKLTGSVENHIPNQLAGRSCIRFFDTHEETKITTIIE